MRYKDLTGRTFGRWTVLDKAPSRGRKTMWHCRCECGQRRDVKADSLTSGISRSCGCLVLDLNHAKAQDFTGHQFGRLTVLGQAERVDRYIRWRCQCACGRIAVVFGPTLKRGGARSCGCLARESHVRRITQHGKSRTREYNTWNGMVNRCHGDRVNHDYGGRGITVCERWRGSFEDFLADMGPRPGVGYSIERIDVNGNYEPGNCRWATTAEQNRNRRDSRILELGGRRMTLAEWSREIGISATALSRRLQTWPVDVALSTPRLPFKIRVADKPGVRVKRGLIR